MMIVLPEGYGAAGHAIPGLAFGYGAGKWSVNIHAECQHRVKNAIFTVFDLQGLDILMQAKLSNQVTKISKSCQEWKV